MRENVTYGGQAVIEGVMMRGPSLLAIAVRRPTGDIALHQEPVRSLLQRYPALRWPVLRGMIALVETLAMGINALLFSANQAAGEDEQLSKKELTITTALGIGLALLLFVVLPTVLIGFARQHLSGTLQANLVEGIIRLGLFMGYLLLISRMKDVQRVLQYHGAEHKVINTFESGEDLTVVNARRHTLLHRRCGTTFLLYVMVVSIALFSFIGWPNMWIRIVTRLALMPLVAGLAYEIIKLTAAANHAAVRWLITPGLMLQKLTTREPDDDQLEVAIAALQAARAQGALPVDGVIH